MRFFFILILLIHLCAFGQIGVNIGLPERGGTYIDLVKENYRWNDLATGTPISAGQIDASGWPTINAQYIIDFRPVAEWFGSIDDPELYRLDVSGTWTCSFIGQADVSAIGGSVIGLIYDSMTNTTTFNFDVAPGSDGFFILNFDNTRRTAADILNSGFTNFKMLRPGYTNDDDLFYAPFIDLFDEIDFSSIRYMVFTNTNGSDPDYPTEIEWEDRKLPTDAAQTRMDALSKLDGACWEHVVSLANRTQTDPWINVPLSASSAYILALAEFFQTNLDPDLNIYVESSNEVWNTAPGFEQSAYNEAEAADLGISPIENHARRTVEIAELFESVFGESSLNSKVNVILCSHKPMLQWWVTPMLNYINDNFGPPSNYIAAISCQTYFSGGHDIGESITDILDDCHASITEQIDDDGVDLSGRIQWVEAADLWELDKGFMSYEGGPDHGGGSVDNIANRILAERSERMCDEMRYNLVDGFLEIGGTLAMQFTLTSSYNRYGCWGLTDDVNNPYRNFKFQCIKNIAAKDESSIKESKSKQILKVFPNPAFSQVNFLFELKQTATVTLELFDALGKPVRTIVKTDQPIGEHVLRVDCQALSSGIYFYTLNNGHHLTNGTFVIE
jgi:hypothetical protein